MKKAKAVKEKDALKVLRSALGLEKGEKMRGLTQFPHQPPAVRKKGK